MATIYTKTTRGGIVAEVRTAIVEFLGERDTRLEVVVDGEVKGVGGCAGQWGPLPAKQRPKGLEDHTHLVAGVLPVTAAEMEEIKATYLAELEAREERVAPGVKALRAARQAREEYEAAMGRWIAGDGLGPRPVEPEADPDALAAEYPRAAIYLRAEAYRDASNHHKSAAGREAIHALEDGKGEDEVRAILENWLPANAWAD